MEPYESNDQRSSWILRGTGWMKINLGSFVATSHDKDVLEMNIVSKDGPNTLKLMCDGGFIGAVHSW